MVGIAGDVAATTTLIEGRSDSVFRVILAFGICNIALSFLLLFTHPLLPDHRPDLLHRPLPDPRHRPLHLRLPLHRYLRSSIPATHFFSLSLHIHPPSKLKSYQKVPHRVLPYLFLNDFRHFLLAIRRGEPLDKQARHSF